MYRSGSSLSGTGECVRAKAFPLVYDHIAENVSNVLMCRWPKDQTIWANVKICISKFLIFEHLMFQTKHYIKTVYWGQKLNKNDIVTLKAKKNNLFS